MSERSFDDFDEFAAAYRDIHTQNIKLSGADSFYFAEMKVRLLQDFEKNNSLKALDIGCGDGATELFMQQYFPNWKVYAIDISERSIEEAKKGIYQTHLLLCMMENLFLLKTVILIWFSWQVCYIM